MEVGINLTADVSDVERKINGLSSKVQQPTLEIERDDSVLERIRGRETEHSVKPVQDPFDLATRNLETPLQRMLQELITIRRLSQRGSTTAPRDSSLRDEDWRTRDTPQDTEDAEGGGGFSLKSVMDLAPILGKVAGAAGGGGGAASAIGGIVPALGKLGASIGPLGLAVTALGGLIVKGIGTGSNAAKEVRNQAWETYGRLGDFDTDSSDIGLSAQRAGMNAGYNMDEETALRNEMFRSQGYHGETLEQQEQMIRPSLEASRALGVAPERMIREAGLAQHTGMIAPGEQAKFANMIASAIEPLEMAGREDDLLDMFADVRDLLSRNLTTLSANQVQNYMGVVDALQNTGISTDQAKGIADQMNQGMATANPVLYGMGDSLHGHEGMWQTKKYQEEGLSNPEGVRILIENLAKVMGYDLNNLGNHGPEREYAFLRSLSQQFGGLSADRTEQLRDAIPSILTGNADEILKQIESGAGEERIQENLTSYQDTSEYAKFMKDSGIETTFYEFGNALQDAGEALNRFVGDITNGSPSRIGFTAYDQYNETTGALDRVYQNDDGTTTTRAGDQPATLNELQVYFSNLGEEVPEAIRDRAINEDMAKESLDSQKKESNFLGYGPIAPDPVTYTSPSEYGPEAPPESESSENIGTITLVLDGTGLNDMDPEAQRTIAQAIGASIGNNSALSGFLANTIMSVGYR